MIIGGPLPLLKMLMMMTEDGEHQLKMLQSLQTLQEIVVGVLLIIKRSHPKEKNQTGEQLVIISLSNKNKKHHQMMDGIN